MDRAHEDSICALDINEMLANGVPDQEVLLAWLTDLHFEDYYDLFASAGWVHFNAIKKDWKSAYIGSRYKNIA